MLEKLLNIFKTRIKSLDILYVIEDIKPAARIMAKKEELPNIEVFCSKNGLFIEQADFKIAMLDAKKQYSNKGMKIKNNSPIPGHLVLYISKIQEKAKIAKEFEQDNDHYGLGLILGYPECCCKFFVKNFQEESRKNNDYIIPISNNTTNINNPFYNNILTTYFDHALISHFPHSFDCPESIALAKKHFEAIKKYSIKIAMDYITVLKCIAIYTPESINILYGDYDENNKKVFHYKKILTTNKNDFYNMLYNSKKLELVDKNCFKINKETMRSNNMVIIDFCI